MIALVKHISLADDPNLFRPQLSKKSMKMA